MATNPMKRREHNAFLIGIVIGLILVLIVGFILYKLYSDTKKAFDSYKAAQMAKEAVVVVAANDIKSGTKLTEEDFEIQTVIVDMDTAENCFASIDEILFEDDKEDTNGTYELDVIARVDMPKGSIIMKNLVEDEDKAISDDTRVQEYSSIVLPSQLTVGDIIDIRLTMPNGQDYVVLSKKEVLKTDATTVWFNVNEEEIQIMNSAMVEAWTITGTKFYAIKYVDAGMQKSATVTYQPTSEVANLIMSTPNVVEKAKDDLEGQWRSSNASSYRENDINGLLRQYVEDRDGAVESGFSDEITTIKQHRSEFIDSLESE